MIFPFTPPLKELTDSELMWRIRKGHDKAFDELYRRYARRLQGFFYRMCGNDRELAADFTQEIFERVWTTRSRYNGEAQVSAWLFTMAYNLCRNEYRHREVVGHYEWEQSGVDEAVDLDCSHS